MGDGFMWRFVNRKGIIDLVGGEGILYDDRIRVLVIVILS